MSKVELILPNDRWFGSDWEVRPQDKEICVVIHRYGFRTPQIYQYRQADLLYGKSDYFLDVYELWDYADKSLMPNEDDDETWDYEPSFLEWYCVDWWKPLGLPRDVDERIKAEIEKWFTEG